MVLPKGPLAPFSFSFFYLVFWFGLVYSSLMDLSWPLLPASYKLSFFFSSLVDSCMVTVDDKFLGGSHVIVLYSCFSSSYFLVVYDKYLGGSHVIVFYSCFSFSYFLLFMYW